MKQWMATGRSYKRSLAEKFFAKVEIGDGCWGWRGSRTADGYGHIWSHRAHRLSWLVFIGEIPDGMGVLHRCDNRICTNPAHLFIGGQKMNMMDCAAKGRNKQGKRIADAPSLTVPMAEPTEMALIVVEDGVADDFPPLRNKRRKTEEEWYWSQVVFTPHCWFWTGCMKKEPGADSWERMNGKKPRDVEIRHWCKNRLCVNPEHLRPWPRVNMVDLTRDDRVRWVYGYKASEVDGGACSKGAVSRLWSGARRALEKQMREVREGRKEEERVQAMAVRESRKEAARERRRRASLRRQSRWMKKKRDAGLCPHCGGKPEYGRKVCKTRREYLRGYVRGNRGVDKADAQGCGVAGEVPEVRGGVGCIRTGDTASGVRAPTDTGGTEGA